MNPQPTTVRSLAPAETVAPDHPFRWFVRFVLVVAIIGLSVTGVALLRGPTALAPCGADRSEAIVELEVAGTPERAAQVLESCGSSLDQVSSALRADLGLIVLYGVVLVASAWSFGSRGYRVKLLRGRAKLVAMAAGAAALFDVLENLFLWRFAASDQTSDAWTTTLTAGAATLAWTKFALLALVILYVLVAMAGYVVTPDWVQAVRDRAPVEPTPIPGPDPGSLDADGGRRAYGISLSGGGVRSASFGLGALQAFDGTDLGWDAAARVTAVSGGAYMAGAWAIARGTEPQPDQGVPPDPDGPAPPRPWAHGSPEDHRLRKNLGYLLQGRGGVPGALLTLALGLAINVAILALLLFIVSRSLGLLVGSCAIEPGLRETTVCLAGPAGDPADLDVQQVVPAAVWLALGAASGLFWVVTGRLRGFPVMRKVNRFVGRLVVPTLVLGAALGVVLVAIPWAMTALPDIFLSIIPKNGGATGTEVQTQSVLSSAVKLAAGLGVVGAVVTTVKKPLTAMAPRLGGALLGLIALLFGLEWATNAAAGAPADNVPLLGIVTAVWLLLYWATSAEWWSMAPFYRSRLRRGYATFRRGTGSEPVAAGYQDGDHALPDGPVPAADNRVEPSIYRYGVPEPTGIASDDQPRPHRPAVDICCAMTVSDKSVTTHYGIPALSFTISADEVAMYVPRAAEPVADRFACSPRQVERLMHRFDSQRLTTMAAVAMSGAAFSPAMGRASMGSTDALLAFANLRLGVWVPNPRYAAALGPAHDGERDPGAEVKKASFWPSYPRVRPGYLLKELFGIHDCDDLYTYITDGGHWDNTGLVEQLRNEALREIVCLDGSGVSIDKLNSFAEAIDLAPQECGVTIRVRLDPLRADTGGTGHPPYAERCATVGTVHRPDGSVGLIWYAKPVLTETNEARLLAYWERDNRYPAHGTIDQFFDEEQFDAYRLLGVAAANEIADARKVVLGVLSSLTYDQFTIRATRPGAGWALHELAACLRDRCEYDRLKAAVVVPGHHAAATAPETVVDVTDGAVVHTGG